MRVLGAYRGVLSIREARALIGASAASRTGDWLYNAALLAYVFSTTHSAAWVGAATLGRLLPWALLTPFGGVVADRYPRKKVLLAGDLLRLGLMLTLAAVVAKHGPVVVVICLAGVSAAAGSAERPAALALLPRIVGEARLGPANALLHTVEALGIVVGPALGALLLAATSPSTAFLANAATFAISALFVAMLRPRPAAARSAHGSADGIAAGLGVARATRFVAPLFLLAAIVEFTYGAQTVQLVVYAKHALGLGDGGYGILLAASGAGGLLSALANAHLATSRRLTIVLVGGAALTCATELGYANTGATALALIVTAGGGAAIVATEVVSETVLARVVPSATLGRIAGLFDAATIAATVAGALLAALLTNATTLDGSFWILGLASLAVPIACMRGLRGLDAASRARSDALAGRLAVIRRLPITQGVSQLVLEQLASASQLLTLPGGIDVIVQGAPAQTFYAIVDGGVVVRRDGRVLVLRGPGESFGERGLLDNAPRNATVTTAGDATLLAIDGAVLLEILDATPDLTATLSRTPAALGIEVPADEATLIDDPDWTSA